MASTYDCDSTSTVLGRTCVAQAMSNLIATPQEQTRRHLDCALKRIWSMSLCRTNDAAARVSFYVSCRSGISASSTDFPISRAALSVTGAFGQPVDYWWSRGAEGVGILCSALRKFSSFDHLALGRTTSSGLNLHHPKWLGYPVRSVLNELPCASV